MKNIIVSIFFFLVLALLGGVILYGVITPSTVPVVSAGLFQVAAFDNGISIFQGERRVYYTISPYNDYIVGNDGIKDTLVKPEDVDKGVVKTSINKTFYQKLLNTFDSYFSLSYPYIEYRGVKNISYYSVVEDETLKIYRFLDYQSAGIESSGTTLNYKSGDFVFDERGNLFTYQTNEDIASFGKIYGIKLHPVGRNLRMKVTGKTIFIVSPNIPGVISVHAEENQTIWVNRESLLVELEEKIPDDTKNIETTMNISLFDDLMIALNSV